MAAPNLAYAFYKGAAYQGELSEEQFTSALPKAQAQLLAITGDDIPEFAKGKYLLALCAAVDFISQPMRGVISERVGSVAYTYTDTKAHETLYDCVKPYLVGTGLLYRGLGVQR